MADGNISLVFLSPTTEKVSVYHQRVMAEGNISLVFHSSSPKKVSWVMIDGRRSICKFDFIYLVI